MKKVNVLANRSCLISLLAALGAGCSQDDVKMIDVPRKDIPQEILNRPIPPEAFKTLRPAVRKQMKKMEEAVKKANPGS